MEGRWRLYFATGAGETAVAVDPFSGKTRRTCQQTQCETERGAGGRETVSMTPRNAQCNKTKAIKTDKLGTYPNTINQKSDEFSRLHVSGCDVQGHVTSSPLQV